MNMLKKVITAAVSVLAMLTMSVSIFAAGTIDANEQTILNELNAKKVPAAYVAQAKNYFEKDGVSVTQEQAKTIIANIDNAAAIAKSEGIKSVEDLKTAGTATIDRILAEVNAGARVLGLTVSYNTTTGAVTVKDKTGAIVATSNIGTKKTGASSMSTVVIITILGLAVVVLTEISKKYEKTKKEA